MFLSFLGWPRDYESKTVPVMEQCLPFIPRRELEEYPSL